ncbi:F-box/WD repeat-containing protein, putative [Entamoeba invadens IP1]|uniref:F-box/WD repeat-containing protein, putative n=1 Tax=Entamoeba invadens IP1 TaxID=370355 RepID=A0A0A1UEY3_ENTIV|nr:F-box/WD repeat-containing protein, putative [Entamoeba invadens IP1]ELP95028.1 F-box/WD repeat-containing protein, putative [Entamoeba invadens IP1]|eukprot:XP_004261799.1 F-box/WD repeat-containing protein, putative [Entamoeba invadens IP1]
MDSLNTSTLLDVSELLSTISANILLDLPVFCEDTTEPYFRAPASFLPIRERREETLQNSVPLLQLPGTTIREILKTLTAEDAVSLGWSCRQLHGIIFGTEGELYWEQQLRVLQPSESLLRVASKPAETYRRCATMRRHWKQSQYTQSTVEGHMSLVKCIELDGTRGVVVTGSSDKKVKVWKIDGKSLIMGKTIAGQNCGVVGLDLKGDDLRIGYKNGVIKDVNLSSGNSQEFAVGSTVTGFTYCGEVVVGYERTVSLYDAKTLKSVGEYNLHRRPVSYAKLYTPQMGTSASFDKSVDFWDLRKLDMTAIRLKGHHAGVNHFDFCKEKIITASNDKTLMVWDIRKPDVPIKTLQNHTAEVIYVRHQNDKVVASSKDMTLSIFNDNDFSQIGMINTRSVVSSFIYDDQFMFCGCSSGEILMYDYS